MCWVAESLRWGFVTQTKSRERVWGTRGERQQKEVIIHSKRLWGAGCSWWMGTTPLSLNYLHDNHLNPFPEGTGSPPFSSFRCLNHKQFFFHKHHLSSIPFDSLGKLGHCHKLSIHWSKLCRQRWQWSLIFFYFRNCLSSRAVAW